MVRNFWIEANVDGRKSKLAGGPRSKRGGFSLTVFQRNHGSITKALILDGIASEEGELRISVRNGNDSKRFNVVTER